VVITFDAGVTPDRPEPRGQFDPPSEFRDHVYVAHHDGLCRQLAILGPALPPPNYRTLPPLVAIWTDPPRYPLDRTSDASWTFSVGFR